MNDPIQSKPAGSGGKVRRWIDSILNNTYNHYLCYLPGAISFFSSLVLKIFFSGIKFDDEQKSVIKKVPEDAIIIYTSKYKNHFEYLYYYTRYKQIGLRFPEIGIGYKVILWQPISRIFKIFLAHADYFCRNLKLQDPFESGYIRDELTGGKAASMSLFEKRGFYKRFIKAKTDPILYIIEMQKTIDRPVYIIPQIMFFSRKPHRSNPSLVDILFGSEENPGKIRRFITLFKNPGKVFVEVAEPVNLKEFMATTDNRDLSVEQFSQVLRRFLISRINRHRQSITGPVLKTRLELKENILTKSSLDQFMKHYADKHNMKIWDVHRKADAHINEIAARYSSVGIKFFSVFVKFIINSMFDGVTINTAMLNKIRIRSHKGPLILVPCHKSHIDYLVISHIMLNNNIPCPHIAAGKNLSFWPAGPIFRSGGAFFIRRSFKGAVLYAKVFTEYIYKLLEEGCNVELFIEGGRSRTGKLLRPQLGLLSIILNAFKNGACEDMNFVPIFIGYDRVVEESSYVHEVEGGQKEPESFMQMFNARKFLKKKYGKIYLTFSEPISIKELLQQVGTPIADMTSKEQNALCRNLANRLMASIDKVTVVTPHALVASAILNTRQKVFSYEYLMSDVETYMNFLFAQGAKFSDTLIIDHVHAVEYVLELYIQRKFIEHASKRKKNSVRDSQFKVNESKRPALDYYKNNCISFFIPAAFTAFAILEKDSFQFSASDLHSGYTLLKEFLKNEFTYDSERTSEYFVRKTLKVFIDDAILMPHPTLADTYNITSAGFRKLKIFSGFLKTYLESYLIVLNYYMRYPKNSVLAKDRLKKIQSIGNRMYKRKQIELKEALSKVNYKNAVDFFIAHGVRGAEDIDKISSYSEIIERYLNCLKS